MDYWRFPSFIVWFLYLKLGGVYYITFRMPLVLIFIRGGHKHSDMYFVKIHFSCCRHHSCKESRISAIFLISLINNGKWEQTSCSRAEYDEKAVISICRLIRCTIVFVNKIGAQNYKSCDSFKDSGNLPTCIDIALEEILKLAANLLLFWLDAIAVSWHLSPFSRISAASTFKISIIKCNIIPILCWTWWLYDSDWYVKASEWLYVDGFVALDSLPVTLFVY